MPTWDMRRLLFIPLLVVAGLAQAEVKLHPIFSDHMVLQRGVSAPIWGWASPGERVTVTGTWRSQASTNAGPDGKWMVKLKTNSAGGGPHRLTVRGENIVEIQDVMLGEVWLCSGQSNMEWPGRSVFSRAPADEPKGEGNDRIRYFNIPNRRASTPQETLEAKWEPCTTQTAPNHSAAAYYFAQKLQRELNVAVGLIESDWGGTEVEVWIREGALRTLPGFDKRIDEVKASAGRGANAQTEWRERLASMEKGLGSWEKPEFDDSAWTSATLGPWESNGLPGFDGYVWYRTTFELDLGYAGLPLHLELGEIDDEDVTFVNGVKVGETKVYNQKRVYEVPAGALNTGKNVLAVRVLDTGGGGGFTTPNLIRLQVGDHECALAPWKMKTSVNLKDSNPPGPARWPAADLYNGMIAPIVPFAFKGALWYQGESNVGRAIQYRETFPLMIKNWRQDFGHEFSFYFVQIAPFNGYGGGGASAELREAQLMTLKLPKTGMVVTTDITDDYNDIHPVNKWDVGKRLALLALNRTYGKKQIDSGPIYRSYKVEGNAIRITFDSAGENLEIRGGDLTDLMIAGEDKKFVPARCKLERNTMLVWADGVAKPVAVRYGFGDSPKPGLFNSAGLPASPFRTDKWPGVTEGSGW